MSNEDLLLWLYDDLLWHCSGAKLRNFHVHVMEMVTQRERKGKNDILDVTEID